MNRKIHRICFLIAALTLISTLSGLIDIADGSMRFFTNIHGDVVEIYGKGLYKNDSAFFAPIFKGTDFTMLFLGIPLLLFAVLYNRRKNNLISGLLITAVLALFLYYSASISFGISYNPLFLVYWAVFSLSLFGLIISMQHNQKRFSAQDILFSSSRGLNIFLILGGLSLFVAWLPDIIQSFFTGKLALTEVYHTQITYILDMGVISPMLFICYFLLKKKNFLGLQLLAISLVCCAVIAVMLPAQSIFQLKAGIQIPIEALITKVAIFVLLGGFALFFAVKFYSQLKLNEKNFQSNSQ